MYSLTNGIRDLIMFSSIVVVPLLWWPHVLEHKDKEERKTRISDRWKMKQYHEVKRLIHFNAFLSFYLPWQNLNIFMTNTQPKATTVEWYTHKRAFRIRSIHVPRERERPSTTTSLYLHCYNPRDALLCIGCIDFD